VIVTLPSAIVVANPAAVMVALEGSELLQRTADVISFPKLSVALNCKWTPGAIVGSAGVTVIDVTALPPADWTPVPDRSIVTGELLTLLVMVTLPETPPAAAGANVTFKMALWPGFRRLPAEIPVASKPGPEMLVFEIVIVDPPEFVKVTAKMLLLPTLTVPKFKVEALTLNPYSLGASV
jgi:hypothetical protein